MRRGGFPTEDAARAALRRMIEGHTGGFTADPNQTVAEYLTARLKAEELTLKPTTLARYRGYVTADLIPALGAVRLDDLGYPHIAGFVHSQLPHGRGKVTVHPILATPSNALADAVRRHRLLRNPARPTIIPRPAAAERHIRTVAEAARFLHYCRAVDPPFADLIEVIIGTGMRKGEALGRHWKDVHLDAPRAPCPLHPLRDRQQPHRPHHPQDPHQPELGRPHPAWPPPCATAPTTKAPTSVSRCAAASSSTDRRQAAPPRIRPNHFHDLCRKAGTSRTGIHDLRHLAATISITAGAPPTFPHRDHRATATRGSTAD